MSRATNSLLAAVLVATLAGVRDARAQFKDEEEPEQAPQAQVQRGLMRLGEANICQWALGVNDANSARSRLESYLTITIDEVDRACGLTPDQKKKLTLAGRGDFKRLWKLVDESVRRYANARVDQDEMMRIHRELQKVRTAMTGNPYETGSLFSKTLSGTLTSEQAARLAQSAEARRAYRFRAKIDLVVATLDQSAGLTEVQRRQVAELIATEIKPPATSSPYDFQVVMIQLAKLPEPKLKPLFDDLQWRVVKRRLEQALPVEAFLIQNGFLAGAAGDRAAPAGRAQPGAPAPATRVIDRK